MGVDSPGPQLFPLQLTVETAPSKKMSLPWKKYSSSPLIIEKTIGIRHVSCQQNFSISIQGLTMLHVFAGLKTVSFSDKSVQSRCASRSTAMPPRTAMPAKPVRVREIAGLDHRFECTCKSFHCWRWPLPKVQVSAFIPFA